MLRIDERRNLVIGENVEATLSLAAGHFMEAYQKAIESHGFFAVALSGGSTPKALFSILTQTPYSDKIDWSKVQLFWSDERAVLPTDPDSNYHMAMQAGFSEVALPSSHIHRMVAEKDIQQNAQAYEELIRSKLKTRGFDLVMLGMGEDGHTASLFPGTEGLKAEGKLVVANYIPQKSCWRMTLTYECINAASNIVIYVMGASKYTMLQAVLSENKGTYPIERVGTKERKALFIIDKAASMPSQSIS